MSSAKDNSAKNTEDKPAVTNDTNPEAAYLSQKCQRVAGALYAVTRFLPKDEPLKVRIRNLALSLVETTHSPEGSPSSQAGAFGILRQIRDQLTIAKDGGLISRMNYHVLVEEIDTLSQKMQDGQVALGPQVNNQYFAVEGYPELTEGARNKTVSGSSKKTAGRSATSGTGSSDAADSLGSPHRSAKQRRRQKILELFEDTDEITVNDVTEVINGYSTKTIQRDLKALVKSGKLEKHGKRRWTSYTRA